MFSHNSIPRWVFVLPQVNCLFTSTKQPFILIININKRKGIVQNFHNPKISDIDDYIAYLSVAWDVNQDYVRMTLDEQQRDYNNGDLKNQDQDDFDDSMNDRYEDQLESIAERF